MITMDKKVGRALRTLPLGDTDVAAAGHRVDYIQDIATRLLASDQSVYHDPARPSAIVLPVRKP
jgi:hypothetical protein